MKHGEHPSLFLSLLSPFISLHASAVTQLSAKRPRTMPLPKSLDRSGPPQFNPVDISDPLTRQMLESRGNETEPERYSRERQEREASRRSKEIDDWIERERLKIDQDREKKRISKVLLLGECVSCYTSCTVG